MNTNHRVAKAGNRTMMNKMEEAIICATVMHQGKVRKVGSIGSIYMAKKATDKLEYRRENDCNILTTGNPT